MYLITQPISPIGKLLGAKPFAWMGRISFSIYLCHMPLVLLCSHLLYTFIEAPGNRLAHRWTSKPKSTAFAAGPVGLDPNLQPKT